MCTASCEGGKQGRARSVARPKVGVAADCEGGDRAQSCYIVLMHSQPLYPEGPFWYPWTLSFCVFRSLGVCVCVVKSSVRLVLARHMLLVGRVLVFGCTAFVFLEWGK